MKALWKGYIVLGQLAIPIRLYSATQKSGVTFVQLHEKDSSPIERPLFCKKEHKETSSSEVIRGVEFEPGKFVSFTNQELERAQQSDIHAITIRQFCTTEQIPAAYYEKPYYMAPAAGGERGYALLRGGLLKTRTLAVVQYYFYGNEHVGAVEVYEDILLLHQLRFADELINNASIKTPPLPRPTPAEMDIMKNVVESYSGPLHLRDYHDEYTERIKLLTERKPKGLSIPRAEQIPAHATPEDRIYSTLDQTLRHNQHTIQ